MYATTSTENSVYIFGGWTVYDPNDYNNSGRTSFIAQYYNDQWYHVGNLNKPRHGHNAITSGSLTFVLGGGEGINPGASLVVKIRNFIVFECVFRFEAEIWDHRKPSESRSTATTSPHHYNYYREVAVFLVNENYCKKSM